ncbi:raffinose/stachyose/melibiose transport system substrate-binding protein [Clostridium tetanomorphum]|uniref:Carbohydrate ABC transporter substrate-binding protein n=1 Tax=Clostridium tetanomorphum TaxID=1553 RepID=A0A923E7L2_CLOTT|nr:MULTISPECIES: ABC transporter substrate-binding protein [Clostridium]KAJ52384.1 ABC transporter substrate-binding protein [Clostridium tetanomorphum DSM 665]MBC2397903.1 carbohydrate ABC transporter substrate-binding protein [Clostridium tetanomorphum]MBC2425471.1 carbohydrate ABC transporter substrate-binding protein [Clostridium beijerinckii]MBP1864781.1 raffinose/stachyose/melibiose transport system substrate-binding protein [Clostridium tetanomorphum]NRS83957.1 raffinose/stachyose/melib
MKRRKLLALTLAVTSMLAFTIAGCGKSSEVANGDGKADKTEVNIFQFKVEVAKELKEAAAEYMKEKPDIKINIETVGGGDDYGAALKAKFQSGKEPTVFNVGGPQDVKDWEAKLEDLTREPWVEKVLPGMIDGVTMDKKIYGLPYNVEGYGLIYNKKIFEAAGIDGSKINSYAKLEEAVKTLDAKIKSGELKKAFPKLEAVFEFPAKEKWVTGLHTSNTAIGQEFKNSVEAYKSKTLEFKYADGYQKLVDLQANYSPNGKSKEKLNAIDYSTQVDQGISIERVAIIQQGNWIYGSVKAVDEKVANNLDILPMAIKGGKEDCIPVGVPMYWAINKDQSDKAKTAAKDFLNWLYTSDKGKDYVANKFFFIPALKGYENYKPEDSLRKAIQRYMDAEKTTTWVFMGYPTAWGENTVGINIQKYLSGKMTWDQLVKDSKAQWEKSRK